MWSKENKSPPPPGGGDVEGPVVDGSTEPLLISVTKSKQNRTHSKTPSTLVESSRI